MRRVMIGTPSYDGTVGVHYTHSLVETVRLGEQTGIDIRPIFIAYDALIQRSRNDLTKMAIDGGFDDLIFIDGDQEWKAQWVMRLLSFPVDCIGGAVRKKSDTETYNVRSQTVDMPIGPGGCLEVDGLGTGFLRLSKHALSVLWNASEEYRDDSGKVCRMMFDVKVVDGRIVGEDILMTAKLREAGIKVYLDPVITCSHIGSKKWDGNFASWLDRLKAQQ